MEKDKYDLICSIGGNCAAAHNMLIRGLREKAYPFDWTYCTSDEAVYMLTEGFKTNFEKYMLKENLKELPVNPSHPDRIQYEDTYAKIVWANHFIYTKNPDKEYEKVKAKFDRRFRRLIKSIEISNRILFLFSSSFEIEIDSFKSLISTLKDIYPQKEFYLKVISFDCKRDDYVKDGKTEIYKYSRKINDYDFLKTNYEWNFLDNIELTSKKRSKVSLKLFKYKIIIDWGK